MLLDSALRTWGSREDLWLKFSRALIARGVRPVLVFSEAAVEELRERFRAHGIEVEAVNYGRGAFHYYRELRKVVRNYAVTAVHIAFFNYFNLIPWLARLQGVRCVIYQERNSGVVRAKSWRKRLLRLRAGVAALPMTRVIAISDYIRRQLIEAGIPEQKIFLAYNGVDTQRFSPDPSAREQWAKRFAIQPDEAIVTSIAALLPFKHPEVVLDAFGLLVKRGVKARLFMAGNGLMRPVLERKSRELGISEIVHWLGNVNPERLLQASDIFVLASVGEAFGMVLAEALACGVPVVGSRSGAIPEIVKDGETGLLATALNPVSFADAIERLVRDSELLHRMQLQARATVRSKFSVETAAESIIRVYESIWAPAGRVASGTLVTG
jgi:glycosyltransferase involved in cell wall biosynthesis